MVTHAKNDAKKSDNAKVITTPIVLEAVGNKRKRKKKKYTKGTKGAQRLTLGLSDALFRSANSLAKGAKTFSKRSKKSSRKKRDGLVRDSLRNASRGIADDFNELGKAPNAIAKRIGTGQVRRAFKIVVPLVPFGR
jgi:hypothetical protein